MEIVKKETFIPARTEIITKYVASDGKEFSLQWQCEEYERKLGIIKHPVVASKIDGLYTFNDEYSATLYYISSEEDYEFVTTYLSGINTESDFHRYGPGWYLFYVIDGGDGPDFYHIFNCEKYIEGIETQLKKWKNVMQSKIMNKMKEYTNEGL